MNASESKLKTIVQIRTIQAKFIVWIVPIVTLLLIALATFIYQQSKKEQLNTIENFSSQIIGSHASEIGQWLYTISLELKRVADNPNVQTMNWSEMEAYLKTVVQQRSDVYGFLLLGMAVTIPPK